MPDRPLILASASPRRAELLRQIGVDFRVVPGDYHEPPPAPGDEIADYLMRTAAEKARVVAERLPAEPALILAADTLVLLPVDDPAAPRLHGIPVAVLGKPRDAAHAATMLRALAGREHTVMSAFCLCRHPEGVQEIDAVATTVRFRALTDEEIADYVATGEPLDKAGAYGIQGRGAVLIEGITGDYYTVVGLPLATVWQRLRAEQGLN